jgi:Transposase DDE domain
MCPAGVTMPFQPGTTVRFPKHICAACPLRARCTTSSNGRSVAIHPDETLLAELREYQATPAGRARLRERVKVEHALAHVGHWQGRRARYRSSRKTCSTCAASPWSTTSTSSHASRPPVTTSWLHNDYLTGALAIIIIIIGCGEVGVQRREVNISIGQLSRIRTGRAECAP